MMKNEFEFPNSQKNKSSSIFRKLYYLLASKKLYQTLSYSAATGGAGGYGLSGANAGNGGARRSADAGSGGDGAETTALSIGTVTGSSSVNVNTYAYGGNGGTGYLGATNGHGGNAIAQSTALFDTGNGVARSQATSTANATADSTATAQGGIAQSVHAHADTSSLGGTALAEARAGQDLAHATADSNLASMAQATSLPSRDAALAELALTTEVNGDFNLNAGSSVWGLVTLGSQQSSGSALNPVTNYTYSSFASFTLDVGAVANDQDLLVGLLGSSTFGTGFDSLHFWAVGEGVTIIDQTFGSVSSAQSYFNDNTLDFGDWASVVGGDNLLDLAFYLDVTQQGADVGGFTVDLLFGNSIVGSGPTSTVPIPGSLWLFGSALAALVARRRLS